MIIAIVNNCVICLSFPETDIINTNSFNVRFILNKNMIQDPVD